MENDSVGDQGVPHTREKDVIHYLGLYLHKGPPETGLLKVVTQVLKEDLTTFTRFKSNTATNVFRFISLSNLRYEICPLEVPYI